MPGSIRSSTTRSAGLRRASMPQRGLAVGGLRDVVAAARAGRRPPPRGRWGRRRRPARGPSDSIRAGDVARRRARSRPPPTTSATSAKHQPQQAVGAVEQGGVVGASRRTGRCTGTASRVTDSSTTSPATTGARLAGRQPGHEEDTDQSTTSGARTASCSTTPPASHTAMLDQVATQPGADEQPAPYADQDQPSPAVPSSHARARITSSPPSGRATWSAAPRGGSARSAGTGSRGRCASGSPLSCSASSVVGSSARLPRTSERAEGPALLERTARGPSMPGGRPDEVEQVAQPHPGPDRRPRSSPRRRRSAASRSCCGSRREVGRGSACASCRRARPRVRTTGSDALLRDAGGAGGLVDREVLRAGAGVGLEDRQPTEPRDRAAGDREHARPPDAPRAARTRPRAGQRRRPAARRRRRAGGERVADDRQLDRDVQHQGPEGDPGDGVVGGAEGEATRGTTARCSAPRWRAGRSPPRRAARSTRARAGAASGRAAVADGTSANSLG